MLACASEYNDAATTNGWPALCDASAKFVHPDLCRLLGLWRRQAKAHGIPLHADMTPRLLKSFLGDIALYERIALPGAQRRWRVRLMGASFGQIMGELSGKFLDETVPTEMLPRWDGALDITLAHRVPLRFLGRADTGAKQFLTGEFFSAPLLGADGSPSMVLGAGRFSGGRAWCDVEAEARLALTSV